VYEVVWLRLAMAQFGVTTPLTSIVLSVFMAGLALGSWLAGGLARRAETRGSGAALRLYAIAELVIAASGAAVPLALAAGGRIVGGAGSPAWGSLGHYVASGGWIVLTLLPFCTAMGATFPLAMAAIRSRFGSGAERSFSFLYVANVLGALAGTLTSAFVLIEIFGFRRTSLLASCLNASLAAGAFALSRSVAWRDGARAPQAASVISEAPAPSGGAPAGGAPAVAALLRGRGVLWLLFATGLISLAMEVTWIRQFTPYLGTVVYAFASVLALYLGGTILGSRAYRWWSASRARGARLPSLALACAAVGITGLLPLVAADPRVPLPAGFASGLLRVALGVTPFCAVAGFLTPMLVDGWSAGDPGRAGSAYAVNVVGCIVGPLLAGFVILPSMNESSALFLLSIVPIAAGLALAFGAPRASRVAERFLLAGSAAAAILLLTQTRSYESQFPDRIVKRDYTATVVARGADFDKHLLVNGYGMTRLTPISKVMAHLPLAFLTAQPQSGLVICFGMGTSFRSMASWGIETTAVELVPSVPSLFGFYFDDGPTILRSPRARIVVDDGRRFLEWSDQQFDVITIDPPPPVEAAGSSLLYSREFYTAARERLRAGGILQQWFPGGEPAIEASVVRAIREAFPHVRAFPSIAGWGFHMLASATPIETAEPAVLASRLPAAAAADLVEWFQGPKPEDVYEYLLEHEVSPDVIIARAPEIPAIRDDRPINEYYALRRWFARRGAGRAKTT